MRKRGQHRLWCCPPFPCVLCAEGSLVNGVLRGGDLVEGAVCGVSFCCFDGLAEGSDRALGFDFCFGLGVCCSFFLEGCEEPDGHVVDDVRRVASHISGVGDSQGGADIFEDKPGFVLIVCHDADVVH
nr:MAG TPA: hypothetical protein [Caudoviricetes sp.]